MKFLIDVNRSNISESHSMAYILHAYLGPTKLTFDQRKIIVVFVQIYIRYIPLSCEWDEGRCYIMLVQI